MSSDYMIKAIGLSKSYQIYEHPRDRLKQFILPKLLRLLGKKNKQYFREFWALKDISIEIKKGETVGIVGRNGSGKSTLLQLICGTLSPSGGEIFCKGKIAALLELGSGFNPEFTGRENVYMNASLLGLSRDQVDERFDKIAQFADIGDFIDQPVKTYSSGMYVRLAFAVIAHVDADILVIDEALAVGDAIFTQKCMRFLRRFQENGTLIFVSHDMGSVLNLCQKAIWLDQGMVRKKGTAIEVSEAYLQYTLQDAYGKEADLKTITPTNGAQLKNKSSTKANNIKSVNPKVDYQSNFEWSCNLNSANGWKTGAGEITSVQLKNISSESNAIYKGGEDVKMVIRATAFADLDKPIIGFLVRDKLGQDLFGENTLVFTDITPQPISKNETIEAEFYFQLPMLPNGQYTVMASLANGDFQDHIQHHWLHDALVINVSSSKIRHGLVGIPFEDVQLRKVQ